MLIKEQITFDLSNSKKSRITRIIEFKFDFRGNSINFALIQDLHLLSERLC